MMGRWLVAVVLAGCAAGAELYISTQDYNHRPGTGNAVGRIDPASGQVTDVRLTVDREGHPLQMFDIAMNSRGELYGVDSQQALWRIDPRTGVSTQLAARLYGGPSNISGLAFHPETDELYLAGNEASVYRLEIATCDGTQCAPLVDMSRPPYPSNTCSCDIEFHQGDIYFAGEFSVLYRLKQDEQGLWYADATSETVTLEIATAYVMKGLVSDGETLWVGGDANQAPAPHYFARVDTERLRVERPVAITGTGETLVSGLAAIPVRKARPASGDAVSRRGRARPVPPLTRAPRD